MSELDILFPEGKEIKLRKETFIIKPFVLRERTKVIRIISEIISEAVKGKVKVEEKDAGTISMELIKVAGERLVEIYILVTKKDKEWFQELTLIEEVKLLKTVMEVNQLPFLLREIQGILNQTK